MQTFYSAEKSVQIVISLLKAHNIKKFVVSPGTTNITLVASIQQDSFFEIYSAADERSAAYIACGLAEETNEPVALSCTGATASRNYVSALTEAFYRKIPVLAITATQNVDKVGHLIPQVIDRSTHLNDTVRHSIYIPSITDDSQIWGCEIKVNNALLELRRNGGGPVHINLATTYCPDFSVKILPEYRAIYRVKCGEVFPELEYKRIAIFIGSHSRWNQDELQSIDAFCEKYGAVVLYDHTSGYKGKYGVLSSLLYVQGSIYKEVQEVDLLIHIGEVSGEYGILNRLQAHNVWRVSEDGELRDTFRQLKYVFEMTEKSFFDHYNTIAEPVVGDVNLYVEYKQCYDKIYNAIPELPFSNIWIAKQLAPQLPEASVLHLGILNSLRSWNFFEMSHYIDGCSNVGGFGIDGCVSALIGASLANRNRLYFGVVGDLAFFYDMNSLGNRHVGSNIRLMVVNNGVGTEFKNYNHPASRFGVDADDYMAAAGHYGNKSTQLVKHYAEDLGFEYITASNKDEFTSVADRFLTKEHLDKPILFEVFTDSKEESDALCAISNIFVEYSKKIERVVRSILGDTGIKVVKKIVKR